MKFTLLLVAFLLLATVAGFGLYKYKKSISDNEKVSQNITERLLIIAGHDSKVNEYALRNRYNLDNNYDRLAQSSLLLDNSIVHMKNTYFNDSSTTVNILHSKVKSLSSELEIKKDLIENFKSHNSILKNSQMYAPIAGRELVAIAEKENLPMAVKVYQEVIIELLDFSLHGSTTSSDNLNTILPKLLETEKQMPEYALSTSIEFMNHINTVIKEKSDTDNYLSKALTTSTSRHLSELSRAWKGQLIKNNEAHEKYNTYMLWYILFLFVSVVIIIWSLRNKISST